MKTPFNAALHYPFPYALNPYAEEMEKEVSRWLQVHYYFLPEQVQKKYLHTGIGHCGGCLFPKAGSRQLTVICRFFLWAFTVDDAFEYADVMQVQQVHRQAMAVLRDGGAPQEALYGQLPQLRRELMDIGSPAWLNRFCAALDDYFQGVMEEIPYRAALRFPDFNTFCSIREKAVNVHPMILLAEAVTGRTLPDEVSQHPALQQLARLTCRILAWANDYFSAHVEAGNDVLNLVLMIQHHRQCTLEAAYLEAVAVHDRDVQAFCELRASLPTFGRWRGVVADYAENLALMMHGYLHWTLLFTQRYKTGGHPSMELRQQQVFLPPIRQYNLLYPAHG